MRTADEIILEYQLALSVDEEIAVIKQAQKEAWNEAIDACIDKVGVVLLISDFDIKPSIDKESALKLKI